MQGNGCHHDFPALGDSKWLQWERGMVQRPALGEDGEGSQEKGPLGEEGEFEYWELS